ncbi:Cold-related protein [Operophtera brumata]|uniref:Cold-related protein n=1 Tax=Operophtera brumata TaxID=104452 RepID=A0A0L7L3W4_OPEBR|nr:Cold-related protein [Operophtera brumata]
MYKSVVLLAVCLVVKVLATPLNTRPFLPEEVTVIALEEPCVVQGGMCMRRDDCDPGDMMNASGEPPEGIKRDARCLYIDDNRDESRVLALQSKKTILGGRW